MAYSYVLTTDVGKVRLLVMDNNASSYTFEDEEIDVFLAMETGVKRASALALETIASNEAFVLKRIEVLDLKTDGPAVAKELRERAKSLRTQADKDDADKEAAEGGGFDIAEMVVDDFTFRQRLMNERLREGL